MSRRIAFLAVALGASAAWGQTWGRENVGFDQIQERARALAEKPYQAPDSSLLPKWMAALSYDQYRDIRFLPEQALWRAENLPFHAQFYHPGYSFREPVILNEFTDTHEQRIRFAEAYFNYGSLIGDHAEQPADGGGFAGFRLHAPLNSKDYYDELISFQGASYWRALGEGQVWGLSARGVAIDTGAPGTSEEFPAFREFWLRKPNPGDKEAHVYALLDGPTVTGAYSFSITPGADTCVDVHAVIFLRKVPQRLGIAPMSSMFWFGENSRRHFDDFRPEVHDSDGLSLRMGTGERIWRPLANDSGRLETSFFNMEKCAGFGLVQRDRHFTSYEDAEANYHKRPSLWIEPTSDWGAGSLMLMEIPTAHELADNIVAMWQPAATLQAGQRLDFSYRQHWTLSGNPAGAASQVVATRTGIHEWQPEQRTMIVDFSGENLAPREGEPIAGVVDIVGNGDLKAKIQGITVQSLPDGVVRLSFQIIPAEKDAKLADIGPLELRASLQRGDDFLTETWACRIQP